MNGLEFFEGAACTGGCVGGPLNFENNYVARNWIRHLVDTRNADLNVDSGMMTKYDLYVNRRIEPSSAMKLDDDLVEAMRKMEKIEDCIHCNSCASKCPYGLNTPDLLRKNLTDFRKVLAGEVSVR